MLWCFLRFMYMSVTYNFFNFVFLSVIFVFFLSEEIDTAGAVEEFVVFDVSGEELVVLRSMYLRYGGMNLI